MSRSEHYNAIQPALVVQIKFGRERVIMKLLSACVSLLIVNSAIAMAQDIQRVEPSVVGMDASRLAIIDELVAEGLSQEKMPGCVVVVARREGVVYRKAFGFRQLQPDKQPMELTTVFDLASLTKPIATATSIMLLIQDGKLTLDQTAASIIPAFAANGKHTITIRHLLTHTSGLIADNSIKDYEAGPEQALINMDALELKAKPGEEFIYSDVGFMMLGRIVEAVSGKSVDQFARERVYRPLGMMETGYLPGAALKARAAITEQRDGAWMQGDVHDPRAWALGGVAGHAGLFSTADDLTRYAMMMLHGGRLGDVEILSSGTFELMTTAVDVPRGRRALGWDARTGYSSNRSDLMTPRAFGHGGFTGTGIWIDPEQNLFVLFLSNRVHPDGKGLVNPLIGRIGTVASAAIVGAAEGDGHGDESGSQRLGGPGAPGALQERALAGTPTVRNGVDMLRQSLGPLQGRRVGLITNQTGLTCDGVSTIRLLHEADGVELVALFSPEHGLEGKLDIPKITDQQDATTGLKVFSLYGETRKPTAESLEGIDTIVFDIQDIGCRFYTYVSTMGNAMRAAAEHKLRFVVLDRVNPIGGVAVQGPVLDAGTESFVGFHTLPVRHGMTACELARMIRAELKLDLELHNVLCSGWRRGMMFDDCGLTWTNPSPNMRSLTQALLYPGVGLVEMTNVSVGRGTDTPFEVVGAPWIDGRALAADFNAGGLDGVRCVPIRFTPTSSKHEGVECGGVNLIITDRATFDPLRAGIQLMVSLRKRHPSEWDTKNLNRLLSSEKVRDAVLSGRSTNEIESLWQDELAAFQCRRAECLMYPE